jgi:glycosyltransferase involved in cell wall biosynthesis
MRIIQLIPQNVLGGAESYGFTLGAAMARRGHEVLLLANRDNGPLFAREIPQGMRARALDRTSRLDPRILSFLIGHVRRFRPHVIHSHNFEADTWARFLGLLFPKIVVVSHLHSSRIVTRRSWHRAWIDRILYRRSDQILALTEDHRRFLTGWIGVPAEKLEILPNGIDTNRFASPAETDRDRKHVVCVASLTDVKNHADLLAAWIEVSREVPEARLTLIGEGPLRANLERQASRSGIERCVEFAGLQTDTRPHLRRAGIFALSSKQESMPLALLEAMASGLACVAPRVGGIPEILQGGTAGLLVAPRDPQALAEALRNLLQDPEQQRELGSRAREKVARDYSLDKQIDRIESAYRKALFRRGGADLVVEATRAPDKPAQRGERT